MLLCFLFKQKTAYEMRISDWSSDVCTSDLSTPETLRAMHSRIAPAASLILPGIPLDVVAFGCTSAAMELGEDTVFAELRKARPDVRYTTPITGALAAFRALELRRIPVPLGRSACRESVCTHV